MASKVLIDANVILDFTLKRDNYTLARRFFNAILERELNGFITPSILHIVGHWLTKTYGATKAKTILLELLSVVTVIDAPHEVMIAALNSQMPDIEDSLQYYTALHHKMDIFISGDKGLKKSSIASLPVYSLNEVIAELLDN